MLRDQPRQRCPLHCIVPPHIFEKLLKSKDKPLRESALDNLLNSDRMRGERAARASLGVASARSMGNGRRTVYDCENSWHLRDAVVVRSENGPASEDDSVNRLFDGFEVTRHFLMEIFERNSLDDRGGRLDGYVHFGIDYNNATFDGSVVRFGDGDGEIFTDFTHSLDVIAHELGHGVIQYTSELAYHDQPGALNESFADVFGSLVKQWSRDESVEDADWLIGQEIWTPGRNGDAMRSLKAPGTAYVNHPELGTDPQPARMRKYVHTSRDNGGVHINSGIPNKAFYETAMRIGGNSWEVSGQIWYDALRKSDEQTNFQQFADNTYEVAERWGGDIPQLVAEGWKEVDIEITGIRRGPIRSRRSDRGGGDVSLSDIMNVLARLESRVKSLKKVADSRHTRE